MGRKEKRVNVWGREKEEEKGNGQNFHQHEHLFSSPSWTTSYINMERLS